MTSDTDTPHTSTSINSLTDLDETQLRTLASSPKGRQLAASMMQAETLVSTAQRTEKVAAKKRSDFYDRIEQKAKTLPVDLQVKVEELQRQREEVERLCETETAPLLEANESIAAEIENLQRRIQELRDRVNGNLRAVRSRRQKRDREISTLRAEQAHLRAFIRGTVNTRIAYAERGQEEEKERLMKAVKDAVKELEEAERFKRIVADDLYEFLHASAPDTDDNSGA